MNVSFKAVTLITGDSSEKVDAAVERKIDKNKAVIYAKYSSCIEDGAIVLTGKDMVKFLFGLGHHKTAKNIRDLFNTRKFKEMEKETVRISRTDGLKTAKTQKVPVCNNDLSLYDHFKNGLNDYFIKCESQKDALGNPVRYERAE